MVFGSPNSYEERIVTRSGQIDLFVFGMILSGATPLAVFFDDFNFSWLNLWYVDFLLDLLKIDLELSQ